jgi:GDP-4-dehydro-6-deoxy-D-mannose reductase
VKVLITGICGFAGSHLAEHCAAAGDQVAGIALPGEIPPFTPSLAITVVEGDLMREATAGFIRDWRPEVIYHLAGLASVGRSWQDYERTLTVNALGLLRLAAVGREAGRPVILTVGSGEVYGRVPEEEQPVGENRPCRPINPYALSKLWQEDAAHYLVRSEGYPLVITRPFNHTGPRQRRGFVVPDFASQIAEIEAGRREPLIWVGNLEARRDFLDVRDVAAAYRLLALDGTRGVPYNIASGHWWSIQRILDTLLGLARVTIRVEVDRARRRPADVPLLSGDASRLRFDTGWEPRVPLEETLARVLDHWRGVVAAGGEEQCGA